MKNLKLSALVLLPPLFFCSPLKAAGRIPSFGLDGVNKNDLAGLCQSLDAQLPSLKAEIIGDSDRPGPVVITASGIDFGEIGWGPLELKHFVKLLSIFFPKKSFDKEALADAFTRFNKDYFFLTDDSGLLDKPSATIRWPENYLEEKLTEIPGYAEGRITVIPFSWSRDPEDTAIAVLEFEKKLVEVYNAYKGTGRPIYIVAHSWGTVLMHETLHRVAVSHPEVKIDKFITAGSPLMPSNPVVSLFLKVEITKEQLQKVVSKPVNVRVWRNFWASRDPYANEIAAADSNTQVDAGVEKLEPALINLILHSNSLKKAAALDLLKFRNIGDWHGVYMFDYKADLASIQKEISLSVFKPLVSPQVTSPEKR